MQKLVGFVLFGLLCGQLNAQSVSSIVYENIPVGHPALQPSAQKALVYYVKEASLDAVVHLRLSVNGGPINSLKLPVKSFSTVDYAGGDGLAFLLAADKLHRKGAVVQLFPLKEAVDGVEAVQWLTALEKAANKGQATVVIKEAGGIQETTIPFTIAGNADQWSKLKKYKTYVEAYERLQQQEALLLEEIAPLTKAKALNLDRENRALKARALQLEGHIQIYLLRMKSYIDLAPISDSYVRRKLARLFLIDTEVLPISIPEETTEYQTLLNQLKLYPELREGLRSYLKAKNLLSAVLIEQDRIGNKWSDTAKILLPVRVAVEKLMQIDEELNILAQQLAVFK